MTTENTETTDSAPVSRRSSSSCSTVECGTCHHWEWDDGKNGFASGYCPIFGKITHKVDGSKCTAWEKINQENVQSDSTATE